MCINTSCYSEIRITICLNITCYSDNGIHSQSVTILQELETNWIILTTLSSYWCWIIPFKSSQLIYLQILLPVHWLGWYIHSVASHGRLFIDTVTTCSKRCAASHRKKLRVKLNNLASYVFNILFIFFGFFCVCVCIFVCLFVFTNVFRNTMVMCVKCFDIIKWNAKNHNHR
jgi:hypothetical protein